MKSFRKKLLNHPILKYLIAPQKAATAKATNKKSSATTKPSIDNVKTIETIKKSASDSCNRFDFKGTKDASSIAPVFNKKGFTSVEFELFSELLPFYNQGTELYSQKIINLKRRRGEYLNAQKNSKNNSIREQYLKDQEIRLQEFKLEKKSELKKVKKERSSVKDQLSHLTRNHYNSQAPTKREIYDQDQIYFPILIASGVFETFLNINPALDSIDGNFIAIITIPITSIGSAVGTHLLGSGIGRKDRQLILIGGIASAIILGTFIILRVIHDWNWLILLATLTLFSLAIWVAINKTCNEEYWRLRQQQEELDQRKSNIKSALKKSRKEAKNGASNFEKKEKDKIKKQIRATENEIKQLKFELKNFQNFIYEIAYQGITKYRRNYIESRIERGKKINKEWQSIPSILDIKEIFHSNLMS